MKIDIFTTEEKYDILYTDPPWIQGRGGKKSARPNSTGMDVPYDTMEIPEIIQVHWHVCHNLMNEKHNVFMWTIDKYCYPAFYLHSDHVIFSGIKSGMT